MGVTFFQSYHSDVTDSSRTKGTCNYKAFRFFLNSSLRDGKWGILISKSILLVKIVILKKSVEEEVENSIECNIPLFIVMIDSSKHCRYFQNIHGAILCTVNICEHSITLQNLLSTYSNFEKFNIFISFRTRRVSMIVHYLVFRGRQSDLVSTSWTNLQKEITLCALDFIFLQVLLYNSFLFSLCMYV